jgi:threonine/homoserine/homoserine lactone efflux protein
MSSSTLAALIVFSFVSSITPGPNNIMLFASGVNFGLRRTWPHAFGIGFGFAILLLAVGVGVGTIIKQSPLFFLLMKISGAVYMLYLAFRIATSSNVEAAETGSRPMTFLEAALFQWVNPKAWVMAVTAMSVYTQEGNYWFNVAVVVLVFVLVNVPSVSCWAGFGHLLSRWLADPWRRKIFNYSMAAGLVLSLWPMVLAPA